jgi:hypothetical protein
MPLSRLIASSPDAVGIDHATMAALFARAELEVPSRTVAMGWKAIFLQDALILNYSCTLFLWIMPNETSRAACKE